MRWKPEILIAVVGMAPVCNITDSLGVHHTLVDWALLLTNMDALAIGCAFAWIVFDHLDWLAMNRDCIGLPSLMVGGLMIRVPYILWKIQIGGFATVPLAPISQSIGFAALMCLSVLYANHWTTGWLRSRPVEILGVLSCSIYISKQIFCSKPEIFGIEPFWFLIFPYWLPVAIIIGAVSYLCIESPFVTIKKRFEAGRAPVESRTALNS